MSEQQLPAVTDVTIRAGFNMELTKNHFQELKQQVANIDYTEENLSAIGALIKNLGKMKTVIETKHKEGKAEALRQCQMWDKAKNDFIGLVDDILSTPQQKYSKMCLDVLNRQKKAVEEQNRISGIKEGINRNVVDFSRQISEAKTPQQLTAIEKMIALEKTRKAKYQEFMDEAIVRFDELIEPLKKQKEIVKKAAEIRMKMEAAQSSNDDEQLLELSQQHEELSTSIEENQITVQERAINSSLEPTLEVATEVYPQVKARRSVWKFEVVNIKETAKKAPSWVKVIPDEEAIDAFLKGKKAEGIEGEEFTVAGIRFYLDKKF